MHQQFANKAIWVNLITLQNILEAPFYDSVTKSNSRLDENAWNITTFSI